MQSFSCGRILSLDQPFYIYTEGSLASFFAFTSCHPNVRQHYAVCKYINQRFDCCFFLFIFAILSYFLSRLYDLSVNIEEPEQVFPLYALLPVPSFTSTDSSNYTPPFTVIDFCFGARDVLGWGRFTVYFLMEDAEIYALCPVLPYNWYPFFFFCPVSC